MVTCQRMFYSLILVAEPGGSWETIYCHPEIECSQVGFLKTNESICNFQIIMNKLKGQFYKNNRFCSLHWFCWALISCIGCATYLAVHVPLSRWYFIWKVPGSRMIYVEDNTVDTDLTVSTLPFFFFFFSSLISFFKKIHRCPVVFILDSRVNGDLHLSFY